MNFFAVIIMVVAFLLNATFDVEAQKRGHKKKTVRSQTTQVNNQPDQQIRIVAEGQHADVEKPFIFVARDARTYELLKALKITVPDTSKFDFPKVAIVAIFAGTKPTPGYKIEVSRNADLLSVSVVSPPPDAILAQVLTSPYKIVAVPVDEEKSLFVQVPSDWKKETYKISKGSIGYSGGFAPREKNFDVDGKIFVFKFDDLITMSFSLTAKSDAKIKISETASGKIEGNKIQLNWVDPGNFSELPRPSMKAIGMLSQDRITLRFEPNPTNVADGFEAHGEIEAVKSGK
jgi:hypothetical protein